MIRSSRRLFAAAVATAAALTVAACGTPQAGSAAVVGDRRITISAVQDAYRDIVPLVGPDERVSQTDVLNWLILEPYLVQAAADAGRGVSVNDARLTFQQVQAAAGTEPSEAGLSVVRANLANSQLQSGRPATEVRQAFEQIGRQLQEAGVEVNPRFGTGLDVETFTIAAEQPNWIATPEPEDGLVPGAGTEGGGTGETAPAP